MEPKKYQTWYCVLNHVLHEPHGGACIVRCGTVAARWRTKEPGNLMKYSSKEFSSIETSAGSLAWNDLPLLQERELACDLDTM